MTNFLRKLMFWRQSADGEASGPAASGEANDNTSPTQEQLDHEAKRREEYFEERRRDDELQLGGHSREEEYRREQRGQGE